MTVSELIEQLNNLDGDLEVHFPKDDGSLLEVRSVDYEIDRNPWDQDFDKTIVVIRP